MKLHIVFHSLHGHCYALAREIREGALQVPGVETSLFRVPETLPEGLLREIHAVETTAAFAHLPLATPETLREADGIVLGAPTYFGIPSAQMIAFLDQTGTPWADGEYVGKIGGAFTSHGEQSGDADTALRILHTFFFHQGMILVSMPTSLQVEAMHVEDIPVGGGVYGASMITGGEDERTISPEEIRIARLQGETVARTVREICLGRRLAAGLPQSAGSPKKKAEEE